MSETIFNLTAGNLGSAVVNVTTGKGSTKYNVDFGQEFRTSYNINFGDRGPQGEQGIQGIAGPNEITTATETNLTGYIYGNGSNVAGATQATTSPTPNTLALRDDKGRLRASDIEIPVKAAEPIAKGSVVYISGAEGANKLISLAQANTESMSSKTIGVSIQALAKNGLGFVYTEGDLSGLGINLGSGHGVEEGDPIWLSPTTAGGMVFGVANKPSAPNHMVFIGYVLKINGNTLDEIYVKIQNGFELQELHNVAISSPTNDQIIAYDSSNGIWENKNLKITNSTTTDFVGVLYGNGNLISSIPVSISSNVSAIVRRDNEGSINVKKTIRLYSADGNFYTQINPSATFANVSFQFPLESATIATHKTALMLSGEQKVNGAKTFNGQLQLDGQSITNGNSALTADLADSRYGTYKAISQNPINSTTTNFAPIVTIVLPVGLYQIDAFLASSHTIGFGCKIRLGTSHDINVGLTDNYGRPSVAAFSWPIIAEEYNDSHPYAVRSDSGAVEYRRTITGIIEILTEGTTLRMDYAQLNQSTASPSTARTRAHILARKIN